jgi:hypothetical protein
MATRLSDFNATGVLVGRPHQEISEESAIQQFPIGTIWEPHGRRFRYCQAQAAISITHRGCPSMVDYPWIATSLYSAKFVSCNAFAAGDRKITLTFDDYCIDNSPYAGITKNFFTGGYLTFFFDTNHIGVYRVTGNEAATVNADSAANSDMIVYLDEPIAEAYVAGCTVDLYASPYAKIGPSTALTGWASVAVIPQIPVTTQYFFWGQTRGPCWVTPTTGITGTTIRDVYFHSDGTIKDAGTDTSLQRAGYIIYKGDNTQDDAMIMLQLE